MGKNENLRYIAVLGGLLGIVAVLISLIPSDVSWWSVRDTIFNQSTVLNAFGIFTLSNGNVVLPPDYLILIAGLSFLIGSLLITFSAIQKKKAIAILSGLIMVVGLIVFCVALNAKTNWEEVNILLIWLNSQSNLLFGEYFVFQWGLGIGFYLAIVGTVIGIIGALVMN